MDYLKMDANLLVSIINMKLRDLYKNLDDLCDDLNISKEKLLEKLKKANFEYVESQNQFK